MIRIEVFDGFFNTQGETSQYRIEILKEYCAEQPDKKPWWCVVSLKPGYPPSGTTIEVWNKGDGHSNNICGLQLGVQNNTGYKVSYSVQGVDYKQDGKTVDKKGDPMARTLRPGTSVQYSLGKNQIMKYWECDNVALPFDYSCSSDPSMLSRLFSCKDTDNVGCAGNWTTSIPKNNYDQDATHYYFDTFAIIARINVYSDKLFAGVTTDGSLNCDALQNGLKNLEDYGIRQAFDCEAFPTTVPCKDNQEMIFGKYCKHTNCKDGYDKKDSDNQCVFQNNLYAAACCRRDTNCGNLQCMTPWKDQIATQCGIGKNVTGVRCPRDRCVVNQSESICDCCSTTGGCFSRADSFWRDGSWSTYGCSGITQCTDKDSEFTTVCSKCRTFCANYGSDQSYHPGAGVATIEIFLDIPNIYASQGSPTLITTSGWRNDLFNSGSVALPNARLPSAFAIPLFTMCLFACVLRVFYDELYGIIPRGQSELASYAYFDTDGELTAYVRSLLLLASQKHQSVSRDVPAWNDYIGNAEWWVSTNACSLPQWTLDKVVEFRMPYDVYMHRIKTQDDRAQTMGNFLSAVVRDYQSPIVNADTGTKYTSTSTVTVTAESLDPNKVQCTCLRLSDGASEPVLTVKALAKVLPGDFVLDVRVQVQVKTWSPMLYAFFTLTSPGSDLGVPPPLAAQMIPFSENWSSAVCGDRSLAQCYTDYCLYYLQPDPNIVSETKTITDLFVNNSDAACLCLRSSYGPAGSPNYDNETAMCFGGQCNSDPATLATLGLRDTDCEKLCPIIDDWLHSDDPTKRMRDPSQVNAERVKNLCPDSGAAGGWGKARTLSINWFWFVATVLLFFFVLYYSCYTLPLRKTAFRNGKKVVTRKQHIFFGVLMTVGVALAVFMGLFLYGNPVCDDVSRTQRCRSQLTNSGLPQSFCTTIISCDCRFDQDCCTTDSSGGGCTGNEVCDRGVCHDVDEAPVVPQPRLFSYWDLCLGILVIVATALCMFSLRFSSKGVYWGVAPGVTVGVAALLVLVELFAA